MSPPQLQSTPAVKRTRQESESSAASAGNARKRGRPTKVEAEAVLEAKRVKLSSRLQTRGCGHVLTLGQGDTGQLGLGEDIMERARPALVKVSREMELQTNHRQIFKITEKALVELKVPTSIFTLC